MEGQGAVIGKRAPDFTLPDQSGANISLSGILMHGPAMLVFYPGDFTTVCTKQLCNYSDNMSGFEALKIQIVGISHNSVQEHSLFATKYKFPFPLLSDSDSKTAKAYDCQSLFMLGKLSRAVFIINAKGIVLYRYVEPTVLTHRSAKELLLILQDLRENKLI